MMPHTGISPLLDPPRISTPPRPRSLFSIRNVLKLLLVFTLLYLTIAWFIVEEVIEEEAAEGSPSESTTIDRRCSKKLNRCYFVLDQLSSLDSTADEQVERGLYMVGFEKEADTIVILTPPNENAKYANSDTRLWKIDHSKLTAQYIAGMVAAPFVVSALKVDDREQEIDGLIIGLGGGSLDMFLRHYRPKFNLTVVELDETIVDLARRWFGIVEDEFRRTIVGDGVDFITNASSRGEKYHIIWLDACDAHERNPCPAAVFRTTEVVQAIRNILHSDGVVVVNILVLESEEEQKNVAVMPHEVSEVVKLFREQFPSCFQLGLPLELNVLLICFPLAIGSPSQQMRFYERRLEAVNHHFGLDSILGHISFN